MKTTLTLLTLLTVLTISNTSFAQEFDEQRVKILPTGVPGFIRLHYAMEINEPIELTFFNEDKAVVGKDKIYRTAAPNGISKRYDVTDISADEYWIQIKTGKNAVVYHILPEKDHSLFTAVLQPTSDQFLVKANN